MPTAAQPRTPDLLDASSTKSDALETRADADSFTAMVERLATNRDVDVDKLAKILDLQERILDRNAEAAFNAAFAQMQPEVPCVIEKAKTDKGTYAPLEDINSVVLPVINKHGFSLSFRTEWPDKGTVKVVGVLTHREGHSRESEFMSAADGSGSKNAIQGLGSAVTYGRRYVTKDLLNITTREQDDDGRKAGKPEPPSGYQDWLDDMTAVADEGVDPLEKAWKASKREYRSYANTYDGQTMSTLKAKARQVRA